MYVMGFLARISSASAPLCRQEATTSAHDRRARRRPSRPLAWHRSPRRRSPGRRTTRTSSTSRHPRRERDSRSSPLSMRPRTVFQALTSAASLVAGCPAALTTSGTPKQIGRCKLIGVPNYSYKPALTSNDTSESTNVPHKCPKCEPKPGVFIYKYSMASKVLCGGAPES